MAKIFPTRMNSDSDALALQPTECRSKLNLRSGLVSGSNALSNENIQSTVLIPSEHYEAGDMVIGSCEDISNDSILFHVFNPDATKNKVLRYFPFDSDRVELVLKHQHLGYKEDWKITQSNVISGLFYFTFGYFNTYLNNDYNPPRKINIEKAKKFTDAYNTRRNDITLCGQANFITGDTVYVNSEGQNYTAYEVTGNGNFAIGDKVVAWINDPDNPTIRYKQATGYSVVRAFAVVLGKSYIITDRIWLTTGLSGMLFAGTGHMLLYAPDMYFGIDWQVLDRIKYPPTYAPTASYGSDPDVKTNSVRDNLFQFSTRFVYDDHEKSVFSPKSEVAFPVSNTGIFGINNTDPTVDNEIVVWHDTGSIEVVAVELAMRKGNIGEWAIIDRLEKYDNDGIPIIFNDINARYDFYNTEVGEPISPSDSARPYDFVPQISGTQELIEKNRLSDADYVEGYDNIDIDVELKNIKTIPSVGAIGGILTTWTRPGGLIPGFIISTAPLGRFFYAGEIDFASFWETGFTYIVSIQAAYPSAYDDPEGVGTPTPEEIYGPYAQKYINATATVFSADGSTFETFANTVVAQLRNGNSGNSCVIGLNRYDYKGFESTVGFVNSDNVQYPTTSNHIGFIIEMTFETPPTCIYCQDVSVRVTKTSDFVVEPVFKSGVTHPFGLFYLDRASRFGAINNSIQSQIYIPSQVESSLKHELYKNEIGWAINHTPPDWATHYAWAYAKNSSISYCLYGTISKLEEINATQTIFIAINKYIADQRENVKKFNVDTYVWEPGDRIRFISKLEGNTYYTLPFNIDYEIIGTLSPLDDGSGDTYEKNDLGENIKDSGGNKIKDPRQMGILVPYFNYSYFGIDVDNTVVEIYRPKKTAENIVYYEFCELLPILNPNTANRVHGGATNGVDQVITGGVCTTPASGIFKSGDAYLRYREMVNVFPCESFSYSDYFTSDVLSIGTPNIVDRNMRRQEFIAYQRYSQILIENSLTNGLSTFYGSDFDVLPSKYEKIYSAKEVGEVLRVIQKNKCHSIYIGKGEMKQPVIGDIGVVAISPSVIGSRRDHVEAYGTVFPESVVTSNNFTYFFDIYNSVYVRWATNGLQQITYKESNTGWDYGMGVFFRDKCTALLRSGIENVKVYAVFEKEYENLIVTFVDSISPSNNETVVFHEPSNSWTMKCSYIPEFYGTNKKVLVMAKDGQLWKANAGTDRNTFFGVSYKSEIELVGHEEPDKNYVFNDMEIVTNSNRWEAPNTGDVQVNLINGSMKSRLKNGRFTNREGVMVATFGKDMTTSGVEVQADLITGRELRGHAVNIRLENDSTEEVILTAVNINSTISE